MTITEEQNTMVQSIWLIQFNMYHCTRNTEDDKNENFNSENFALMLGKLFVSLW